MNDDDQTPADLSREIGVDAKRIRTFLRARYGKLNRSVATRWRLSVEQADAVRAEFLKR